MIKKKITPRNLIIKKKPDDKTADKASNAKEQTTTNNDVEYDVSVSSVSHTLVETWDYKVNIADSDFVLQPRAMAYDKKIILYTLVQKQIK